MVCNNLKSLKYNELQKLAKSAGIRANQKIEKLIQALEEYYIESEEESKLNHDTSSHTNAATVETQQEELASSQSQMEESNSSSLNKVTSENQASPVQKTQSPDPKRVTKRRRTFELEEATLGEAHTPTSDSTALRRSTRSTSRSNTPVEAIPAAKRQRRDTFDKTDSPGQKGSPGTAAIIESMDANQSSAERKNNLLSAIDKRIQSKISSRKSQQNPSQPSQIPRFLSYLKNIKEEKKTAPQSGTPGKNWTKIHAKEFSKLESIDTYLEKKQQRKDMLMNSDKKVIPKFNTAANNRAKIAKPVVRPQAAIKPFVPSVISTKNLSFNFSKTPTKPSLPQSASKPGISSTRLPQVSKTPKAIASKSAVSSNRKPQVSKTPRSTVTKSSSSSAKKALTQSSSAVFRFTGGNAASSNFQFTGGNTTAQPFKFTGSNNPTLNISASAKKAFDLKASLARPLTWKPHTGRLQQVDTNKPTLGPARPTAPVVRGASKPGLAATQPRSAQASTKGRPAITNPKDVRRVAQYDRQNNQKYVEMMRRRGLM